MRIWKSVVLLLAVAGIASANTLFYTVTGSLTNGAQTPTPFQLTFTLLENPVPSNHHTGSFEVVTTDAIYSPGGAIIPLSSATIDFWDVSNGGLFDIIFSGGHLAFSGSQIFQGSTSNPLLLKGTFPATFASYQTGTVWNPIRSGQVVVSNAGTPEPVTPLLIGFGVAGLLVLRRKLGA
jgi:hypothetical protein